MRYRAPPDTAPSRWPTSERATSAENSTGYSPVASERVLLRAGDAFLWSRTRDADTVEGAEGWFTEPLMSGQRICPDPQISYCWDVVQEPKEKTWRLSFRTGPDEETYRIKRGTGVVHYHYAHHGTTNEVTAELVEFTPGAP